METQRLSLNKSPEPLPVRSSLEPAFYKDFHCLADKCRDDCCHDWGIYFNKKDYLAIKRAPKPPEVEEIIRRGVTRLRKSGDENRYAEFAARSGPCPLQDAQGLCRLQIACGGEVLPAVCRQFPRLRRFTPMGLERSLTLACEGVLQLLWEHPEGVSFVEEELPRAEWRNMPDTPGNRLFPLLRSRCIDLLQARQYSLPQRILLMGMALEEVRQKGFGISPGEWSARVDFLAGGRSLREILDKLPVNPAESVASFLSLCLRLGKESEGLFREIADFLEAKFLPGEDGSPRMNFSLEKYRRASQALSRQIEGLEPFLENMMVSLFFQLALPRVESAEDLWKSYVDFCQIYGFLRFCATAGCGLNPSRERLFHAVVMADRALLHNEPRRIALRDSFFETKSDSLAHMAILVQGV